MLIILFFDKMYGEENTMSTTKRITASLVAAIILVSSMFCGNLLADTGSNDGWSSADRIESTRASIVISFSVAHGGSYTTPEYTCYTDHPYVSYYNCSGGPAHVNIYVGTTLKGSFTIPVTGTTTINIPFSCNYKDKVYFVITAPSTNSSGSFTLHTS